MENQHTQASFPFRETNSTNHTGGRGNRKNQEKTGKITEMTGFVDELVEWTIGAAEIKNLEMQDSDLSNLFLRILNKLPRRQRITVFALYQCKSKEEVLKRIFEKEGRHLTDSTFERRMGTIHKLYKEYLKEEVRRILDNKSQNKKSFA